MTQVCLDISLNPLQLSRKVLLSFLHQHQRRRLHWFNMGRNDPLLSTATPPCLTMMLGDLSSLYLDLSLRCVSAPSLVYSGSAKYGSSSYENICAQLSDVFVYIWEPHLKLDPIMKDKVACKTLIGVWCVNTESYVFGTYINVGFNDTPIKEMLLICSHPWTETCPVEVYWKSTFDWKKKNNNLSALFLILCYSPKTYNCIYVCTLLSKEFHRPCSSYLHK